MKKVILTLALGLFFVTFTNAQNSIKEVAEAQAEVVVKNKECAPDCKKDCCAGKESDAKATKKESKSCEGKATKKSCETKAKGCASKKRPDSCKH